MNETTTVFDKLTQENERLTRDRNDALAICWAVEEWMAARISSDQLNETAKRILSTWGDP